MGSATGPITTDRHYRRSTDCWRQSRWQSTERIAVGRLLEPHGNWKTVTFIAALRHDRVTAPFVLEGPMTGEMFKAYTEQFLAPTLKRGNIVFTDNVSVHKVDGIEEAIEARGAIPFYLPAYSPDLNPIEQLFAKLKALLRKVAAYTLKNAAFTVRSLCNTVASCLDQISRAECAAYLANSGYGQPKRRTL